MSVPISAGLIEDDPRPCQHCHRQSQFCRCEDEDRELTFWQQQLSEDELTHERN